MIKLKKEGKYLMGYNENNKECCYYPLKKEAKELDLPLLPNPFEIDTNDIIDREALMYIEKYTSYEHEGYMYNMGKRIFKEGYKAAQSKQFSLEDILQAIKKHQYKHTDDLDQTACPVKGAEYRYIVDVEDIENELKSLSTQQLPKEFIPEYEIVYFHGSGYYEESQLSSEEREKYSFMKEQRIKTITNSKGKQELVGVYKY